MNQILLILSLLTSLSLFADEDVIVQKLTCNTLQKEGDYIHHYEFTFETDTKKKTCKATGKHHFYMTSIKLEDLSCNYLTNVRDQVEEKESHSLQSWTLEDRTVNKKETLKFHSASLLYHPKIKRSLGFVRSEGGAVFSISCR